MGGWNPARAEFRPSAIPEPSFTRIAGRLPAAPNTGPAASPGPIPRADVRASLPPGAEGDPALERDIEPDLQVHPIGWRHQMALRNPNLTLAARACVGHIRPHGAVAEWLKAAVC